MVVDKVEIQLKQRKYFHCDDCIGLSLPAKWKNIDVDTEQFAY